MEAEALRRAAERRDVAQRLAAAAAEALRRQGRLAQFRAAVGWCAPQPNLLSRATAISSC